MSERDEFEAWIESIDVLTWESFGRREAALAAWQSARASQVVPALYQWRMRPMWEGSGIDWSDWENISEKEALECEHEPIDNNWEFEVRRLYAAPQPSQEPRK